MIKHAEKAGNGAVRGRSVEGPPEPERIFGRAKFGMRMNERKLISRSIVKEGEF